MKKQDLYELLEVNPKARPAVLEAAYKALIKEFHPDKEDGNSRIARSLNEARETLLDPLKRAEYDKNRTGLDPKVIGNYRVERLIAEGGFGKTYLAEHIYLGTPACVKHALQISPQDEEILMDEARAIWDLRHFGIPAIRELLKLADGSVALVMSYIPGPTLAQIVEKNSAMELEHVLWILERIFNILKYLHYHGVIHGDVKPQNIIVQPESHTVVLVDYGLSMIKPRRDSRAQGFTPAFAPPEQLGSNVLLPQSDFYSLAVTAIYALGGDIAARSVPQDVPEAFCRYIKRFLVHDVLARPSWDKEDFTETIAELRVELFGRRRSDMKPIPNF